MKNYYEILEVDINASQAEIKRAYIRLIKLNHPDRNHNKPDATYQTQQINLAYETLKDELKRWEYDQRLNLGNTNAGNQESYSYGENDNEYKGTDTETEEEPDERTYDIYCQNCRRKDPTLRVSIFLYVISFIIITQKNSRVKVLCSTCRLKSSLLWNLQILFFGWWGVPYGVIYSFQALANNFNGGEIPNDNNENLLNILSYNFYKEGNYLYALEALKAKMKYRTTENDLEFLEYLEEIVKNQPASKKRKFQLSEIFSKIPTFIFNILLIASLITVFGFLINSDNNRNRNRNLNYTHNDSYTPPYEIDTYKDNNVKKNLSEEIQNLYKDANLPKVELPLNGQTKYFVKKKAIAPLKIETTSNHNYFIKIIDYNTAKLVETIFIRGGENAEVKVPLGSYLLKYATGERWHGEKYLFGSSTEYYKAEEELKFEVVDDMVSGWDIQLYLQYNGNLETTSISEKDFNEHSDD